MCKNVFLFPHFKPVVPKKPKRSVPVSSSMDRESHRETGRVSAVTPLSREASDIMPTPTVRKTDVRTETQPNGSEVTTTIVEFTDQVSFTDGKRILELKYFYQQVTQLIYVFQDHGITGLSEVSYSTRPSVSPVSTNRGTAPILV